MMPRLIMWSLALALAALALPAAAAAPARAKEDPVAARIDTNVGNGY
jgi:hypothetical protein